MAEKFSEDYEAIRVMLKKKTEVAQNINPETSMYKPSVLYPATGTSKYKKAGTIMA